MDKKLFVVTTTEVTKFFVLADDESQVEAAIEAGTINPDESENHQTDHTIALEAEDHNYTEETAEASRIPVI